MGWETAIMIGFSVLKGASSMSNANAAAKSTITEGNIALKNKAKDIARKTGSLTNSFLSSGLTFDGTPMNVVDSEYASGIEDLNQLGKNYNTKAKNQISAGRSQAIDALASGFGSASFGDDIFGGAGSGTTPWGTPIKDFNGGIDPGGTDLFST